MKFLRLILFPLIPVYALVVNLRNLFFDKNVFKSQAVEANVISVGNITVGGSGKTPLVIYLINLLKKEGFKVGVLSRGYGRKSKGYLLVSDGSTFLAPVEQSGDEIFHTVSECNVPGAVSENRVKGARRFISDADIDTIILDDGFQHRWISRDIDILICEQRFLITNGMLNHCLLPAGNLRESFNAIERADAVIINRKFSERSELPESLKKYFQNKIVFTAHYKAIGFVDIMRNTFYEIEEFKNQKSLVVSGIANPFSLLNALKQNGVNTNNKLIFSDHKTYRQKDIQLIRKKFYSTNSHSVVTTQKDAVKLSKFNKELDDIDVFHLKIELQMDEENLFKQFINKQLMERRGNK